MSDAVQDTPRAMNLVRCMERHLGPVDSWPTLILMYLFCKVPVSTRVKTVTAFFYGNNVPLNIAVAFFHACNAASSALTDEEMRVWYRIWHSYHDSTRLFYYYDVRRGHVLYKSNDHVELAYDEGQVTELGLADCGCELYVRSRLDRISAAFPHVYCLSSHPL